MLGVHSRASRRRGTRRIRTDAGSRPWSLGPGDRHEDRMRGAGEAGLAPTWDGGWGVQVGGGEIGQPPSRNPRGGGMAAGLPRAHRKERGRPPTYPRIHRHESIDVPHPAPVGARPASPVAGGTLTTDDPVRPATGPADRARCRPRTHRFPEPGNACGATGSPPAARRGCPPAAGRACPPATGEAGLAPTVLGPLPAPSTAGRSVRSVRGGGVADRRGSPRQSRPSTGRSCRPGWTGRAAT